MFDCHAHLIADDDTRYPPAPLSGALRDGDLDERFPAARLLALMDAAGVDRICAVQRVHVYGYDPAYIIDSAAAHRPRMLAVVAIDATATDAAGTLRRWMAMPQVVGVRFAAASPQVRDTAWLDSDAAQACWAVAADVDAPVCVHAFRAVRTQVLAALDAIMSRFPGVKVVIDHLAHQNFEDGSPDFGFDLPLQQISRRRNLYLKLTTINLRRALDATAATPPAVAHLVGKVGAARIMWGSDIGQTKGDYTEMAQIARDAVATLRAADQEMILNGTCSAFYAVKD